MFGNNSGMPFRITEEIIARQPPEAQAIIRLLLARIAELEAQVGELTARMEALERQAKGKTPENSSLPPSTQHPHNRPQRPRHKSKKKRGGQLGHEKHERPLIPTDECDDVHPLRPTGCRRCGAKLSGRDPEPLRHQVWELPEIKPIVTEYQRHRLTCPACGETTCAELPAGVPHGQSGPRLMAFTALLMAYYRQSKRRTAQFLNTLLGQPCCAALTVKIQNQVTAALRPSYEALAAELPKHAEKLHKSDVETLKQYVDLLPPYLTRRFISAEQDAVIVSGRVPDSDASQLLPIVDRIDKQLNAVRAKYPAYKIAVTGLSVISARNSALMIDKLSDGLTIEIAFVAAFIGLAFWSPVVMLISILPGLFPIVLAGCMLLLTGQGLQFASVIALTVSFGLGLSATIHFLNRLQIEDIDPDPAVGVERATILVGPPLILTSAVLACGLAMTVLSSLPSLRLFGWLSAFAMVAALLADMFMLRPIAMFLSKVVRRMSRRSLLRSSTE